MINHMKVIVVHILTQSFRHCPVALVGMHYSGEDILLTAHDLHGGFIGIGIKLFCKLIAAVVVEISGVHIENQLAIFDGIRFQPSGGDDLVLLHLLKHFYIIVSGRLEVNIQRSTFRHDVHIGITVFFTLIVFLYFCHIEENVMLRIEHLSKAYGEKKAVDDLNLHIAPGEIYGFIGHNGAGKTTTLKSVAGILQFDQGEIYVDGKSIRTQPLECKRTFAYIPDNPDLYDYMTGIKYLNFVADIFGVSAADRQDRIRQYAGLFELTEDLAQPIAAYSHGMKQKLAIISAWLHRPRLILMDEPFVGLDPKASHLLKGMMRQVCDEGGAIFFSTHVLEVAEKLCDKVAIIQGGRLIRSGTMEEVKGDDSLEDVFLELEGESC